jgi:hypothetical protein
MKYRGWVGILGIAVLGTGWLASGNLYADVMTSDGYSVEDFKLHTANELVDICTIETKHPDHAIATAFCYGFFEGAVHYDEAIAGTEWYKDIVCNPADTTRTQAVTVFTQYIKANPQYGSEQPIDAIFRALVAKWPCTG